MLKVEEFVNPVYFVMKINLTVCLVFTFLRTHILASSKIPCLARVTVPKEISEKLFLYIKRYISDFCGILNYNFKSTKQLKYKISSKLVKVCLTQS